MDAFAKDDVITRSLGYMSADVMLSPSSWAVPSDFDNEKEPYGALWDTHYSRICREFSIWIAGASNVGPIYAGPWAGWKCIGCPRVTSPEGKVVAVGPYGAEADTIVMVEIAPVPRPARGCDWAGVTR